MKISTNLFFDRASQQIVNGQQKLARSQMQLATGKQIVNPSDAPEKASTLQRLRTALEQQQSYRSNLDTLTERLENQNTALQSVSSMLTRMRELAIQYGNGTLGAEQRRVAAIEVRGIRDQMLALANSRDTNGLTLFGGSRVAVDAFNTSGVYQGDQTSNEVPVGTSQAVLNRRGGDDIFRAVVRLDEQGEETSVGFFEVIDNLALALEANDAPAVLDRIDEITEIHQGIALSLADVGSDLNVVESQQSVIDEQLLRLKSVQSDLQDLDYAEAVSRMQKEMLGLEAAQSSFAQISRLSLFNYIGN
jgi:flagellar hook-associated protein 3 FlgL